MEHEAVCAQLVMTRYQDFNFDSTSIRYLQNIDGINLTFCK